MNYLLLLLVAHSFGFISLGVSLSVTSSVIQPSLPRMSIILTNLQSGANIGSVCRNCLAFNVTQVIMVGRRDFNGKMRNNDRGAKFLLNFVHFNSLEEAVAHLKAQDAIIAGIEISEESKSVLESPFYPHTAFMFGNEGGGLSDKQRKYCDQLVYIPQYATGMASINVACASAIVMHSFASWAKYPETTRKGGKFQMESQPEAEQQQLEGNM